MSVYTALQAAQLTLIWWFPLLVSSGHTTRLVWPTSRSQIIRRNDATALGVSVLGVSQSHWSDVF